MATTPTPVPTITMDKWGAPHVFSAKQEQEIERDIYQNSQNPQLPPGATFNYTQQTAKPNEMAHGSTLGPRADLQASGYESERVNTVDNRSVPVADTAQGESTTVQGPAPLTAPQIRSALSGSATSTAAQGTVDSQTLQKAAKVQQSDASKVDWQYTEMQDEAKVEQQLTQLLTGLEDGEIPTWAKPAVAIANNMLAERGVGRSSAARDTLYNAIITSALPIAEADAAAERQEWLENLNSKDRLTMFNATIAANIDMKNADYVQQANAQNAQAFLTMDLTNLSNEQRSSELNAQLKQQSLISNAAAENATRQFNASSTMQVEEFMRTLSSNIAINNATRRDAMTTFNTAEKNTTSKFNVTNQIQDLQFLDKLNADLGINNATRADAAASFYATAENTMKQFMEGLQYQADVFNSTMKWQVEQSNVNYLRSINTANTAGINAANQANVLNKFNLYTDSLATITQTMRDSAKWAFEATENESERQIRLAMTALTNEALTDNTKMQIMKEIGSWAINVAKRAG